VPSSPRRIGDSQTGNLLLHVEAYGFSKMPVSAF
jgi:hypothetical protein